MLTEVLLIKTVSDRIRLLFFVLLQMYMSCKVVGMYLTDLLADKINH